MMATVPPRQRSKLIARLLEDEVKKREQELYRAVLASTKSTSENSNLDF
jgi:hypothetical protein